MHIKLNDENNLTFPKKHIINDRKKKRNKLKDIWLEKNKVGLEELPFFSYLL